MIKARNTPCIECQNHRRKCVRSDSNHECVRCRKFGKICQQPTKQEKNALSRYNDMANLQDQVKQLQDCIYYMEEQLANYRYANNSLSEMTDTMVRNLFHNWKFTIENGSFQIETGIRSISELLQFSASISYLSPINYSRASSTTGSVDETGIILNFEKNSSGSLIPFTISIVEMALKTTTTQRLIEPSIPSILSTNPIPLIHQLLNIYFHCHNIYIPLVHERTYRAKLATVQDPLSDLITLSICSYVCSAACQHITFTPRERRSMGDYFYAKAKDIILDQFDEREKRLENAMAINILTKYMHITLKFSESFQLVSMSYQILMDLKSEYPEFSLPNLNDGFEDTRFEYYDLNRQQDPITDVDKMLITRHVLLATILSRFLDYVSKDTVDKSDFHFPMWKYIADEPPETIRAVMLQNWLINLHNQSFMKTFLKHIQRVQLGRACTLSFESIVTLDQVIQEYVTSVPAEYLLCADLFNIEMCTAAIDQTTDMPMLMSFIHFHVLSVSIYSCLLHPKALSDQGEQLLSVVLQHSLKRAMTSSQLLLYAIHRLAVADVDSCSYALFAGEFLFNALDVLILLSLSPNKQIASEARFMMKSCLKELDNIGIFQGNQVPYQDPSSPSPMATNTFRLKDGKYNISYYDKFPYPWIAMMHDASHYISSQ